MMIIIKLILLLVATLTLGKVTYEYKAEHRITATYDEAQASCRAWGGDLATVSEDLEQIFTNLLLSKSY
jgi:hypothetical protein